MKKIIKKKIKNKIKIKYIKIYNISNAHKKFNKKNSHYKIIVVSNDFYKINILRRHQIIYNILSNEININIYGIEIFTYTKKEWDVEINKKFSSTKCINQ
ncbi:MAG: BolA family transcriptional regulator [Buchnera aphidicola (Periphyllus aceris)]|nr:BolA family transcriptional regulator [Buchnera aphidicola (Periphyllus aceris)]